jgi:hypothetical protein
LECASLLAPCFAAACCRSAKSPNSRGEASFALEFEHFAGTEARVLLTRAEGPAVNSPAREGGDWKTPTYRLPPTAYCLLPTTGSGWPRMSDHRSPTPAMRLAIVRSVNVRGPTSPRSSSSHVHGADTGAPVFARTA